MMKFGILIFLALMLSCVQTEKEIVGDYVLQNPNEGSVAEILELNMDSTFIFSGLENKDNYRMTWVIEGNWKLEENTIWLNSVGKNSKGYGQNINLGYLMNYSDSVEYLPQAIMVCQNWVFVIENGVLSKNENGVKLKYLKNNTAETLAPAKK